MLIDIRKKIQEEVDKLIPKEFRCISIWGPPISEVQEAKMSVGDALQDGKTLVIRSYEEKLNQKRKAGEIEEGRGRTNVPQHLQKQVKSLSNYLKVTRDQTEERLHNYLYDLKHSSDALFEALNSQEASLRKFKAKQLEKEPSDRAILSPEEENEIASNIFSECKDN